MNQSRLGFELVSPCPFPVAITITQRTPVYFNQFITYEQKENYLYQYIDTHRMIYTEKQVSAMNFLQCLVCH